ncbi:MAG: GH92 family glycosyl hydrolase, partial [Bacteroidota bacterium]|nr:GH92 family glycosyl hydrolase [Bacteroidota bacterium]
TGVSDYGDILLMPTTGELLLTNGADGNPGYRSKFSHKNEQASAGFYQVFLEDYNVNVELTVSKRAGFHKDTFPKNEAAQVVLDLEHRDKLLNYKIEMVDSNTLQGIRYSDNWASEQKVHFYIQFSETLRNITFNKKLSVAGMKFGILDKPLIIKVGISAVSKDGAKANLLAEIPHWNFEKTKAKTNALWEKELSRIVVRGESKEQKEIFYTALYHSLLNPNLYIDVDGNYNGTDLQKHHTGDKHYTVFSLWDTFRATHPLFTLIQQKRTNQFIRTFLRQYKEGGQLPIWELAANYTGCMIGYHAIPVIVDAYVKGIRDYDAALALEAMVSSANQNDLGLSWYKKNGFIAASDEPESVSKNLEYAYDDWCIAVLADSLEKEEIATTFYQRGQYYKNLFDPSTGFFRAKKSHTWFSPFRPEEVNFNYTEANAWQYSLFAPQDISGHIKLMGGAKNYEQHLDNMFRASTETSGRKQPDITGLIGQYAHGNEPSHHMAYLYNYVGAPHKTQKIVRQILEEQYTPFPDGLSGNEDCGQMSSWYVLSAMGFYSVTPGLDYYTIGTPIFERTTINLENGNTFIINAENVSDKNIYIQSASLNGEKFESSFIKHSNIINGGVLTFKMGKTPSNWGNKSIPISKIEKNKIIPVPYFIAKSQTFTDKLSVELGSAVGGNIYYKINDDNEKIYDTPIVITTDANISCRIKKGEKWSKQVSANYYKTENTKSIKIESVYANQYAAAGDKTLIDHLRGGKNYRTGNWQGYREDLIAIIDLREKKEISSISLGCMQDIKSWIFFPKQVEYFSSTNGEDFVFLGKINTTFSDNLEGSFINNYTLNLSNTETQYIKVIAENYGVCPSWHLGAGGKTWLFVDELKIK